MIDFSDGANIALILAKKYPDLIHNMVLISGNYCVKGIKQWVIHSLKALSLILAPIARLFETVKIQKWKIDLMLEDLNISVFDLGRITIPSLILSAEKDFILEEHTANIHKHIKGSEWEVIKGANHMNIMKNNQVLNNIYKFLSQIKMGRGLPK